MRTLAIIPARRGSKGLPGKHLLDLGGSPMIAWTLEAALDASRIDEVLVTSDEPRILALAKRMGAETIERPAELAGDMITSEPVVEHALRSRAELPERIVLLQPTSPLRDAIDIDEALERLESTGAEAVISVVEPRHHPLKCMRVGPDGCLRGLVDGRSPFRSRQSLPRVWMPNGAIYAIGCSIFLAEQSFLARRTLPHPMPSERSVDVDGPADLDQARREFAKGWLPRRAKSALDPSSIGALVEASPSRLRVASPRLASTRPRARKESLLDASGPPAHQSSRS
ncbi:MAG: acylneuraminate cytidylyltransferase family protein [Myxococcales bacterium]|nr:acylneuraminate cytidylyltransferase family protein [Myxococcales bacterium]